MDKLTVTGRADLIARETQAQVDALRAQRDVLRAENLRLREALDNLAVWCPKQAAARAQGCGVATQMHVEAREAARALLRELLAAGECTPAHGGRS